MNAPVKFGQAGSGQVWLGAKPQRTPFGPIGLGLGWRTGDRCRGCGHSNWLVGRTTAECAVCGDVAMLELDGK